MKLTPAEVELVGYAEAAFAAAKAKRDRSLRLIAEGYGIAGDFRIVPTADGLAIEAVTPAVAPV